MQTLGQGGTRLTQLPLDGSAAYDIPVRGGLSITPNPLRANAIAPDGRILVCVASLSSWFWPVPVLDPTARTLSIVFYGFGYESVETWGPDGNVLAAATTLHAPLWWCQPIKAGGKP